MKKKFLVGFVIGILILGMAGMAGATVLTFDNHPDAVQNSYGAIGSYGGFNFATTNVADYANRMDWIDTVGSSWGANGSVSGDFTMLNNYGGSAIITSSVGDDFTFSGLWARIWDWNDESREVGIEAFNNGSAVWSANFNLTDSWAYIAGSSVLIDELHLNFGNYFLVDNLALNELHGDAVPEPSTMLLLGCGIVGLAGVARRKMKR